MFAQKNVLSHKKSTCSFRKTRIFLDVGWTWWTPKHPDLQGVYGCQPGGGRQRSTAQQLFAGAAHSGWEVQGPQRLRGECCRFAWDTMGLCVCVPVYLLFYLQKKRLSAYLTIHLPSLYRCIYTHIYIIYVYIWIYIDICVYMNIYIYICIDIDTFFYGSLKTTCFLEIPTACKDEVCSGSGMKWVPSEVLTTYDQGAYTAT